MDLINSVKIPAVVFVFVFFCFACKPDHNEGNTGDTGDQKTVLWLWDRPCDMRFLVSNEFEFALLTMTFEFDESHIKIIPRHSSALVGEHALVVPVIRLESIGASRRFSTKVTQELIENICAEARHYPNAMKIQIDFDAKKSERDWYRNLLIVLRNRLPADWSLSVTAIASWCYEKEWLESLPADEIVPMFFRMGRDSRRMRQEFHTLLVSLNNNRDNREYCPGISLDEPLQISKYARRLYVFNPNSWNKESSTFLRSYLSNEKTD